MEEVRHSARKLRTESRGTDGLKKKKKEQSQYAHWVLGWVID